MNVIDLSLEPRLITVTSQQDGSGLQSTGFSLWSGVWSVEHDRQPLPTAFAGTHVKAGGTAGIRSRHFQK